MVQAFEDLDPRDCLKGQSIQRCESGKRFPSGRLVRVCHGQVERTRFIQEGPQKSGHIFGARQVKGEEGGVQTELAEKGIPQSRTLGIERRPPAADNAGDPARPMLPERREGIIFQNAEHIFYGFLCIMTVCTPSAINSSF